MRSKYEQRKTAEIGKKDKERKLKWARRTAFNEVPDRKRFFYTEINFSHNSRSKASIWSVLVPYHFFALNDEVLKLKFE